MEVDRVAEVIRKAKAIIPMIKDAQHKSLATLLVQAMEDSLQELRESNVPCPPELEPRLEQAFAVIESLYDKTAAN